MHARALQKAAVPRARRRRVGATLLLAAAWAALVLPVRPGWVAAQSQNLVDRISNERVQKFEEQLTERLNTEMRRYIDDSRYVLAVKVQWNPEIVPVIEKPETAPDRQKLPGFPIFVRAPDSPAVEEGPPPFTRLEVKVLLDETLPEYYERFVRKLVPIVARFDYNRGDQLVVLKETFPTLPEGGEPPTLPERELMDQLGEYRPGQQPPERPVAPPSIYAPQIYAQQGAAMAPPPQQPPVSPTEAAQMAFDDGRYQEALRIAQAAFQRATTSRERSFYVGMEGSIYYSLGNTEAARKSWERALTYDPTNMEVHKVLNYLESRQAPQSQAPGGAPALPGTGGAR